MKRLKVYVSTDCTDLSTLNCEIMFPENGKHPKEQVKFIEELLKENIKSKEIVTNSPYILQAIRFYSAKEGIENCVVYLDKTKDGLKDITNSLNDIFVTYAASLRDIMNIGDVRVKKEGFTTQCLIRKITPKLINKLTKLGYRIHDYIVDHEVSDDYLCASKGVYFTIDRRIYRPDLIYCGENESLFLALAALREDSDYMQWFTDGKEWKLYMESNWDDETGYEIENNVDLVLGFDPREYHKATVEELIEHFGTTTI